MTISSLPIPGRILVYRSFTNSTLNLSPHREGVNRDDADEKSFLLVEGSSNFTKIHSGSPPLRPSSYSDVGCRWSSTYRNEFNPRAYGEVPVFLVQVPRKRFNEAGVGHGVSEGSG